MQRMACIALVQIYPGYKLHLILFNRIIRSTLSYLRTMDKPQHIYCGSILPSKIGKVSVWGDNGKVYLM